MLNLFLPTFSSIAATIGAPLENPKDQVEKDQHGENPSVRLLSMPTKFIINQSVSQSCRAKLSTGYYAPHHLSFVGRANHILSSKANPKNSAEQLECDNKLFHF